MKLNIDKLRRIAVWPSDPAMLLNGARRERTPDGRHRAEVIRIEPEEDIDLPSVAVSLKKELPLASFVGVEPALLTEKESSSYVDFDGMEYTILRGRYCIANRTVVFFAELHQDRLTFHYVVCRPDFPVSHPIRTFEARKRMFDISPVSRKTLVRRR